MSALPPKADIGTQLWNVRFVPKADIRPFIDGLIGAGEDRLRTCKSERPYFEVDGVDNKIGRD